MYGHAKKFSAATPSTNVPVPCELCDVVPPRKTGPAFWKYSVLPHIQSAHPRYWDDIAGVPINLPQAFANKIAISREELTAFGIVMGLSDAPTSQTLTQSLVAAPVPVQRKRALGDITNAEAGPSKRPRQ